MVGIAAMVTAGGCAADPIAVTSATCATIGAASFRADATAEGSMERSAFIVIRLEPPGGSAPAATKTWSCGSWSQEQGGCERDLDDKTHDAETVSLRWEESADQPRPLPVSLRVIWEVWGDQSNISFGLKSLQYTGSTIITCDES